jgi:hypothetical protein
VAGGADSMPSGCGGGGAKGGITRSSQPGGSDAQGLIALVIHEKIHIKVCTHGAGASLGESWVAAEHLLTDLHVPPQTGSNGSGGGWFDEQ